jgi:hypothetical protein
MVALVRFNHFGDELLRGSHRFAGSSPSHGTLGASSFKLALTNDVPGVADETYPDVTPLPVPANAHGYPYGGAVLTVTMSLAGGITTVKFADVTFTAAGGTIGPFRYGFIYNNVDDIGLLVAFFDHGSSITLADGEDFKVDFDQVNGVFKLT